MMLRRRGEAKGPGGTGAGGALTPPMLELRAVRAGYGRFDVLRSIDLSVARGEVLTILGPNGAGKSTLIQLVAGYVHPAIGTVHMDGRNITRMRTEGRAHAGLCVIPEGRGVFPNLSVREHLEMWSYRGDLDRAALADVSYERFPVLKERREQPAGTLSGGEQQMLALTRALCPGIKLLMLDEMSTGLAPKIVAELYEFVGELATTGMTVVIVEQFARLALRISSRAAVLVDGAIAVTGSPAEVESKAKLAYLGGSVPIL